MNKMLFDASLMANAAGPLARRSVFNFMADAGLAPQKPDGWYRIARKGATDDEVDILIYDEISWWGISATEFVKELREVTAKKINLHINSPGGSVFDGLAIYNALVSHPAEVIVHIDGWAASIASVIAMSGDRILISEAAQVMIHKPWSFVIGDSADMRKEAEVLDSLEGAIVDVYVARTSGDRDEIVDWVAKETWFKGQAAVDAGFADEVVPLKAKAPTEDDDEMDTARPAASMPVEFFATIFPNLPDEVRTALAGQKHKAGEFDFRNAKPGEFKKFLMQHGASHKVADSICKEGFRPRSIPPGEDERSNASDRRTTPPGEDVNGSSSVRRLAGDVRAATAAAQIKRLASQIRPIS